MTKEEPDASKGTHRTTKNPSQETPDTWMAGAKLPGEYRAAADQELEHGELKQIIKEALDDRLFNGVEGEKERRINEIERLDDEIQDNEEKIAELQEENAMKRELKGNHQQRVADLEKEDAQVDERVEEVYRNQILPSPSLSVDGLDEGNEAVQNWASDVGLETEEFIERLQDKAEEIEVDS